MLALTLPAAADQERRPTGNQETGSFRPKPRLFGIKTTAYADLGAPCNAIPRYVRQRRVAFRSCPLTVVLTLMATGGKLEEGLG